MVKSYARHKPNYQERKKREEEKKFSSLNHLPAAAPMVLEARHTDALLGAPERRDQPPSPCTSQTNHGRITMSTTNFRHHTARSPPSAARIAPSSPSKRASAVPLLPMKVPLMAPHLSSISAEDVTEKDTEPLQRRGNIWP